MTAPKTAEPEKLLSYKEAARSLNVPYFKIQRAAKAGLIPTYRLYNSRRLVRMSEILAFINASKAGGMSHD